MWNDTDIPLAIFFTFRTYGTWLHGDERGAVDRHNNIYRAPKISANANWKEYNERLLKHEPVLLDAARRRSVEAALRETCEKRFWGISAIHVRTNHAHSVLSIGGYDPDRALGALKANATRRMREDGVWLEARLPHGRKKAVADVFGMKDPWSRQPTTSSTAKARTSPNTTGGKSQNRER